MDSKTLYSLSKDVFVQLICKIQQQAEERHNVKNFTHEQCKEIFQKTVEQNQRLTAEKIRKILLSHKRFQRPKYRQMGNLDIG